MAEASSSLKRSRDDAGLVDDDADPPADELPDDLPDELDEAEIMRMLEEADKVAIEKLTPQSLKKTVLQLERKLTINQQQRVQFASAPEKFAESELDLHEHIAKVRDLSTAPDLYDDFLKFEGPKIIIACLAHVNTDIVLVVLDLLNILTDPENFSEDVEGVDTEIGERFADALLERNMAEM